MTRLESGTGPAQIVSRANGEHYTWGRQCDGWHLVRGTDLSVIEERMPARTSEQRHRHERSRQFFYVLEGELTLEVEHHVYTLRPGDGLEVHPGLGHQAQNNSAGDVRMLVISQPPGHGDRIDDRGDGPAATSQPSSSSPSSREVSSSS